jgi:hypothetical protein
MKSLLFLFATTVVFSFSVIAQPLPPPPTPAPRPMQIQPGPAVRSAQSNSARPTAQVNSSRSPSLQDAFLDLDDDTTPITAFSRPGFNYLSCNEQNQCEKMGWLRRNDTRVWQAMDSNGEPIRRTVTTIDPTTGHEKQISYSQIVFSYRRDSVIKDNVSAWVESQFISDEKIEPIYGAIRPPEPVPTTSNLPCDCEPAPSKKNKESLNKIDKSKIQSTHSLDLEAAKSAIKNQVGQCPLSIPDKSELNMNAGLFYDNHVLPKLEQQKSQFPKRVQTSNGIKNITWEDMVNIDALSRTVYGEMASCMRGSPVYGMAVARTALNRADVVSSGHPMRTVFQKPNQQTNANKPILTQVLMAPEQFSVWNHREAKKPNDNNILRVLCPPTKSCQGPRCPNFKKTQASNEDYAIWDRSLQVATEAVLFEKEFKNKTSAVNNFYYTTNVQPQGDGYQKVAPKIAGRTINSSECMWMWRSPASERLPDRVRSAASR